MFKLIIIASLNNLVSSHSWLDCLGPADREYKLKEQFFGQDFYDEACTGYPRNYPGREDVDINTKYTVAVIDRGTYKGATPDTAPVCTSEITDLQATPLSLGNGFPLTRAKAGESLKLWHELDGHRSDKNIFVWGTGKPLRFENGKWINTITTYSEMLNSTKVHQDIFSHSDKCNNIENDNSLCWSTWQVPNWQPGNYSFVWNWKWDKRETGEEYNTCFELEITSNTNKNDEIKSDEYKQSLDEENDKQLSDEDNEKQSSDEDIEQLSLDKNNEIQSSDDEEIEKQSSDKDEEQITPGKTNEQQTPAKDNEYTSIEINDQQPSSENKQLPSVEENEQPPSTEDNEIQPENENQKLITTQETPSETTLPAVAVNHPVYNNVPTRRHKKCHRRSPRPTLN